MLLLWACGGDASSISTAVGDKPSLAELNVVLQAEFDRLGIDPAKVTAAAPKGATNAVFDLSAELVDPDGAGGDPPEGIELRWTERLLGDYNQDGMVTQNDLTPIAVYWEAAIPHEQPELHGGIEYWPDGDPDGSGAGNWRLARADGNDNGLIEIGDITTIAQHWEEKLTGFRVYRKGPGESEFTELPDPTGTSSNQTISRPPPASPYSAVSAVSAVKGEPVRYSFIDTPPGMGEYEYYVIGWSELSGHSSSEAETPSNHVTASMDVSLTDTTPPVWDSTAGITSAVDNGDGTVTIEWGTATDIAVPPAPASPPVSYNVYYSTESPIDFVGAMKVSGQATTTWTSGKLVAGQEYFFAVRVQDSATPANEDENTADLGVTVTDPEPVEDHDPPVWTESYISHDWFGNPGDELQIEGIKKLEVSDGRITITCANTMDELNPPVHYDFYYVSGRVADALYDSTYTLHPQAQVIQDIPKVFEFEWENRHLLRFGIRARDSAEPANQTRLPRYYEEFSVAPSNLKRIEVDANIPMSDSFPLEQVNSTDDCHVFDPTTHTLYVFYRYKFEPAPTYPMLDVWVLEIDMDTGEWVSARLGSWDIDTDGVPDISSLGTAIAPDGSPWIIVTLNRLDMTSESLYFHRTGPQQYEVWDPPDMQGGWSEDFSFNNYPAFYVTEKSEVNPNGQFKLYYRWWDDAAGEWHQEFVCDPGGLSPTSFLRPDGVVQLITYDDLAWGAPEVQCYGHIHERAVDGTWTEVLRTDGKLSVANIRTPYWNADWAWTGDAWWGTPYSVTDRDMLVYSMSEGYFWIEELFTNDMGIQITGNWPAEGGYHIAPSYFHDGSGLIEKLWQHTEISFADADVTVPRRLLPSAFFSAICCDLETGWYATLKLKHDPTTDTCQVFLWTASDGQSMYDLDN